MTDKEFYEMVIILANADYEDNITCYTTAGKIFEREFKNTSIEESRDINDIRNSYDYKKESFQLEVVEEWLRKKTKTRRMKNETNTRV